MERGGLDEFILGIFPHELDRVGIGACAFADGLAHRPQPSRVHVGVTQQCHTAARGVGCGLSEQGTHDLATLGDRRVNRFVRILHGEHDDVLIQLGQHGARTVTQEIVLLQFGCHLQYGVQVEHESKDVLLTFAQFDAAEGADKFVGIGYALDAVMVEGGTACTVMSRIAFHGDVKGLARDGALGEKLNRMEQPHVIPARVENAVRLTVDKEKNLHRLRVGTQIQLLALQLLGHCEAGADPEVLILAAPLFALVQRLGAFGRTAEMLGGAQTGHVGQSAHGVIHPLCIDAIDLFQFFNNTIGIGFS